jgi:4-aminobutyrate aminotransferase-like enzyme
MADTIQKYEDCVMTGLLKSVAPMVADKTRMNKLIHPPSFPCRVQPVADLAENPAPVTPGKQKKSFSGNGATEAEAIRGSCLENGLLGGGGVGGNVVRFQPPLVITGQQIGQSIGIFTEALRLAAQLARASA